MKNDREGRILLARGVETSLDPTSGTGEDDLRHVS
jgi:hypothetical protein